MLAASYGTVGDIEVLWCLLAASGFVFSLYTLIRAIGDKRYLALAGIGNGRRAIARFTVLSEGGRAAIQLIFLAIGIISLLLPQYDASQLPTKQAIAGALITWGLLASSTLLTIKSYAAYRLRKQLVGD